MIPGMLSNLNPDAYDLFTNPAESGAFDSPDYSLTGLPAPGDGNLQSDIAKTAEAINGKQDDTWFTPQRIQAMKNAAKQQQDNTAQTNMTQDMKLASPQLVPAQLVPLQMMPLRTRVGQQSLAAGGTMHRAKLAGPGAMMRMGFHGSMRMPGAGTRPGARPMGVAVSHPDTRMRFADGGAMPAAPVYNQMPPILMRRFAMGGPMPGALGQSVQQMPQQIQGALPLGLQSGPGDGRSDSILSQTPLGGNIATGSGEYVIPADTVSAMGNGSTEAGARFYDQHVKETRKRYRHHLKNLPSPKK